jgi:uncharacterized protein involved in exopolysaccharide biosynthesis
MSGGEPTRTAAETVDAVVTFIKRSLAFWKRSTVVFLLVAMAAVPAVFLKARVYKSETVVLYQETIRSSDITGGEGGGDNARRVGARLREMLLSRASLEPIVLDLPRYAQIADRRGMVDAVDELRGHISFRAREGDTFEIGFEGASPHEVQDVTRRLGDRIVQEAANRRAEQAKALKEFLDAESDRNKAALKTAEGNMGSFLALHPEFLPLTLPGAGKTAVPGAASALLPPAPAGTKDPQLFAMEMEAASIDRQLRAARGAPVVAPQAPQESAELVAARKDLADKLAHFTPKHPDVVAAQARVRAAEAEQRKLAAASPDPPPSGAKLSDADRENLETRLAILRRQIAVRRAGGPTAALAPVPSGSTVALGTGPTSVALEVEFRRLQREVEDLRERQRQLDDKQFKASITASSVLNDRNIQVSILDPAYLPAHPISKPRSTSLATFLAVGLILAILTALVSARLDDRIFQRADLEVLDMLPVVGVIPRGPQRRRSG